MPQLTIIQRTKIIEFWHQTQSVVQVQRMYRGFFNTANAPDRNTIRRTGWNSVQCELGHSGRPRSGRSVEHVDAVRELVVRSPRKSIRRLSAEANIHRSSVQRILRADLHVFPYKIQSQNELTPQQMTKRFEFAGWFSRKLETDDLFLRKLHMTDECHAHLSGKVNSQNF